MGEQVEQRIFMSITMKLESVPLQNQRNGNVMVAPPGSHGLKGRTLKSSSRQLTSSVALADSICPCYAEEDTIRSCTWGIGHDENNMGSRNTLAV